MKAVLVISFLIIGVAHSTEVAEEGDSLHSRDERAASTEQKALLTYWRGVKPAQIVAKCDQGYYAYVTTNGDQIEQITCLPCGKGKFTPYKGLWKNCVDCPVDLTSGDDTSKGCAVGCGLGKGYNCTTNKCFKCPPGTYNDEATGFHVCKKCGKHQKSVQGGTTCAMNCPRGWEPQSGTETTCVPCGLGFYNKKGGDTPCLPCCDPGDTGCEQTNTITSGTVMKYHCFKLINRISECLPPLTEALQKADDVIKAGQARTLLKALCLSGADLAKVAENYAACKDVKIRKHAALPRLKFNETHEFTLGEVVGTGDTPSCDTLDVTDKFDEYSARFRSSRYRFATEPKKDWNNAQAECALDGARLVEIETADENAFVKSQLDPSPAFWWINGEDFDRDRKTYVWHSAGSEICPFDDFADGEPNFSSNEYCLVLWTASDHQWGDDQCQKEHAYICELEE